MNQTIVNQTRSKAHWNDSKHNNENQLWRNCGSYVWTQVALAVVSFTFIVLITKIIDDLIAHAYWLICTLTFTAATWSISTFAVSFACYMTLFEVRTCLFVTTSWHAFEVEVTYVFDYLQTTQTCVWVSTYISTTAESSGYTIIIFQAVERGRRGLWVGMSK